LCVPLIYNSICSCCYDAVSNAVRVNRQSYLDKNQNHVVFCGLNFFYLTKRKDQYRFSSTACRLVGSFLSDRCQKVVIGNEYFQEASIGLGNLQGSVLSNTADSSSMLMTYKSILTVSEPTCKKLSIWSRAIWME
jgi:hypothetical protein